MIGLSVQSQFCDPKNSKIEVFSFSILFWSIINYLIWTWFRTPMSVYRKWFSNKSKTFVLLFWAVPLEYFIGSYALDTMSCGVRQTTSFTHGLDPFYLLGSKVMYCRLHPVWMKPKSMQIKARTVRVEVKRNICVTVSQLREPQSTRSVASYKVLNFRMKISTFYREMMVQ